jgi:hypothetical protein
MKRKLSFFARHSKKDTVKWKGKLVPVLKYLSITPRRRMGE